MPRIHFYNYNNNKIAYRFSKRSKKTIVFIHGLQSDMNGTKASFFYNVARRKKYSYLSMDLRGHGLSSGVFNQLSVKDWYQDLDELIKFLKVKQIVIVGSSMGGWLAINYTLLNPSKIIKLIGLAPAPDFTELLLWKNFSDSIKKKIMTKGVHKKRISKEFVYEYSKVLIMQSRPMLTNRIKSKYNGEVIFFQGSKDTSIPYDYNNRFLDGDHFQNLRINIIKDADHSLSDIKTLKIIEKEF